MLKVHRESFHEISPFEFMVAAAVVVVAVAVAVVLLVDTPTKILLCA